MIRYLSLGAGVQSSALLVLSTLGLRDCPRADVAIFADTQDEPEWVYTHLRTLTTWAGAHGIDVVTVTAGRLADETLGRTGRKRRAALPVFTLGADGRAAMLPRQCTNEYKIAPITRYVRAILGYAPRQRIRGDAAEALIGLSFDERIRVKPSRTPWIVNRWPLIDAAITRSGCVAILERVGLPVPYKSACLYCPFHDDRYWQDLKAREPQSFDRACAFDDAIRDSTKRGLREPVYLHRSLIPLRDVTFQERASGFDFGFSNECTGHCGV